MHVAGRVRHEPDLEPGGAKLLERRHDSSCSSKLWPLPAARDLDRAVVRRGRRSAHPDDDALGELEPDSVVVRELRVAFERGERSLPPSS